MIQITIRVPDSSPTPGMMIAISEFEVVGALYLSRGGIMHRYYALIFLDTESLSVRGSQWEMAELEDQVI